MAAPYTRPAARAQAGNLGQTLDDQYTAQVAGFDRIGGMLVSDPTKSADAAQNIDSGWAVPKNPPTAVLARLKLGAAVQAYETLFPAKYSLYRVSGGDTTQTFESNDVTPYECVQFVSTTAGEDPVPYFPFQNVPQFGGAAPTVSGEGSFEQWVYAGPDTRWVISYSYSTQFPPGPLFQKMFQGSAANPAPFNLLQFPLEAYANATENTYGVTRAFQSGGLGNSNPFLCQVKRVMGG
jgi:hypothetical protein